MPVCRERLKYAWQILGSEVQHVFVEDIYLYLACILRCITRKSKQQTRTTFPNH